MTNPYTSKAAGPMPSGYGADIADIQRQQQYADLLRQQALEGNGDTQMVSGWAVKKSPFEGMAKMLQAWGSRTAQDKAIDAQKALEERMVTDRQKSLSDYLKLSTGTPESANGRFYPAGGNPDEESGMGYQPAQAPDKQAALAALLSAKDPALQQMGLSEMQKEMQRQRFAQMLTGGQGTTQGATQGVPGFTAHGVPMDQAQLLAQGEDPIGGYTKLVEELRKPKMSQDGKVLTYQNTNGQWGYAPAPGSVQAMQAFQNVANANDIVEVPDGTGGTIKMPKDQALKTLQTLQSIQGLPDPAHRAAAAADMVRGAPTGPAPVMGRTPSKAEQDAAAVAAKDKAEKAANAPQAQKQAELVVRPLDNALNSIAQAMNHPGLSAVTGPFAGRLPSFREDSVNAQAAINTVKRQVAGAVIQAMRDASKSGGAVGNVTEGEWPRLEGMIASLEQAQTTDEFQKALDDIQNHMLAVRTAVVKAHMTDYPSASLPTAPEPVKPIGRSQSGSIKVLSVEPVR